MTDAEKVSELVETLMTLERHVAMECMDRLIEDGGRIVGWEKTPELSRLLDDTRAAIARATGGSDE